MAEKDDILDLFEELLQDETQREIIRFLSQNMSSEDIVKALLKIRRNSDDRN